MSTRQSATESTAPLSPHTASIQIADEVETHELFTQTSYLKLSQFLISSVCRALTIISQTHCLSNDVHPEDQNAASQTTVSDTERRQTSAGIWASWRVEKISNKDGGISQESMTTSSYHPPGHDIKNMKVIKPSKAFKQGQSSPAPCTVQYSL